MTEWQFSCQIKKNTLHVLNGLRHRKSIFSYNTRWNEIWLFVWGLKNKNKIYFSIDFFINQRSKTYFAQIHNHCFPKWNCFKYREGGKLSMHTLLIVVTSETQLHTSSSHICMYIKAYYTVWHATTDIFWLSYIGKNDHIFFAGIFCVRISRFFFFFLFVIRFDSIRKS